MIKEERILKNFIDMVAFPSEAKAEKQLADFLISKLVELGLEVKVDKVGELIGGDTGNVWAFLKGNIENAPKLFFAAHMDSVAPNTGTTVIEKDDILYSDGATTLGGDDKVGIAAIIEALQTIKENNLPHGDIQVCFTVAEEIGCLGAKNLDTKDIIADYGYILDIGGAPGIVVYAAPAMLQIYVTVLVIAAHSGVEPE